MPCLKCSVWLPVGLCLFYHLDPWGAFFPFLLAAFVHELGHILCVWLSGGRITAVELRLGGAILETSPLTYKQEAWCALAGPLSGLLFGFSLGRQFPWVYFWTVLHSVYNLLPVYPLDGGRVLRSVLCLSLPLNKAERITQIIGMVTIITVLLLSLICLTKLLPHPYALVPPLILFFQTYKSFSQ